MQPEVIAAVLTPFDDAGALDAAGARRLYGHLADAGVDGVFVAGTTGEFPALADDERVELFRVALEVFGPDRTIAHVGAASALQAAGLARAAVAAGATRLAAITPYYLPATVEGVRAHLARVADAAAGAALSIYLFPARTGVEFTPDETARLIAECGLAGAKLTIPGTGFLAELATLAPDAQLYSGNDALVAEVAAAGGRGVVSGASSSLPEPFVALARAVGTNTDRTAEQARVDGAVTAVGHRIALGKAALVRLGVIGSAACRMAVDPPSAAEAAVIDEVLARVPARPA